MLPRLPGRRYVHSISVSSKVLKPVMYRRVQVPSSSHNKHPFLTQTDFLLLERFISPKDVVLILDTSGSMENAGRLVGRVS